MPQHVYMFVGKYCSDKPTYHITVFTCVIISPSYPVISPSSITHHILSFSCAPADVCEVTMMVSKKWDEKLQDLAEPGG